MNKLNVKLNKILFESVCKNCVSNDFNTCKDINCSRHEDNSWQNAKTGVPIEIKGFRGQFKNQIDISRGIFYTPYYFMASIYSKNDGHIPGVVLGSKPKQIGHVRISKLKFKNPLVVNDDNEILSYFLANGFNSKIINTLKKQKYLIGSPHYERFVAKNARKLGHDGIIYLKIENNIPEFVDLRQ